MLTVNKLEKIIELEEKLRAEYQEKLDAAASRAEHHKKELAYNAEKLEKLQATIDQQLETIQELSTKALANEKVEQRNRELHNRSDNLQADIATLKQRVKALQKDLAAEREQVKTLTQYDPARMKKNLDANKKKLAEKTKANDLLQKSLKEARNEKLELQRKVEELESQLPADDADAVDAVDAVDTAEQSAEEKAA
jgi:chromosome segregation ATPase